MTDVSSNERIQEQLSVMVRAANPHSDYPDYLVNLLGSGLPIHAEGFEGIVTPIYQQLQRGSYWRVGVPIIHSLRD